jgi:hypothetical protein
MQMPETNNNFGFTTLEITVQGIRYGYISKKQIFSIGIYYEG